MREAGSVGNSLRWSRTNESKRNMLQFKFRRYNVGMLAANKGLGNKNKRKELQKGSSVLRGEDNAGRNLQKTKEGKVLQ